MLTPKVRLALRYVRRNGQTTAREFARFMWPDSPGWQKTHRCGAHGSTQGSGMWLAGGSFLGKLRKQKLLTRSFTKTGGVYLITGKGLEELIEGDGEMFTE